MRRTFIAFAACLAACTSIGLAFAQSPPGHSGFPCPIQESAPAPDAAFESLISLRTGDYRQVTSAKVGDLNFDRLGNIEARVYGGFNLSQDGAAGAGVIACKQWQTGTNTSFALGGFLQLAEQGTRPFDDYGIYGAFRWKF